MWRYSMETAEFSLKRMKCKTLHSNEGSTVHEHGTKYAIQWIRINFEKTKCPVKIVTAWAGPSAIERNTAMAFSRIMTTTMKTPHTENNSNSILKRENKTESWRGNKFWNCKRSRCSDVQCWLSWMSSSSVQVLPMVKVDVQNIKWLCVRSCVRSN